LALTEPGVGLVDTAAAAADNDNDNDDDDDDDEMCRTIYIKIRTSLTSPMQICVADYKTFRSFIARKQRVIIH